MPTLDVPTAIAGNVVPQDRGNAYVVGTAAPLIPYEGQIWIDTTVAASPIYKTYYNSAWRFGNGYRSSKTILASNYTDNSTTAISPTLGTLLTMSGLTITPAAALELWLVGYQTTTTAATNRIFYLNLEYINNVGGFIDLGKVGWSFHNGTSADTVHCVGRLIIPPRTLKRVTTPLYTVTEDMSFPTLFKCITGGVINFNGASPTASRLPTTANIQGFRLKGMTDGGGTVNTVHITSAILFTIDS